MPLWTAFLQLPMFEVKVETPGAPRSSVHRTVASMINRVQAKEWMLPLSAADRKMHQTVHDRLQSEQDETGAVENCLQYGENDPLPLDDWVPSSFTEEQGKAKYRQHMAHAQDYVGPLCQFFY